MTKKTNSVASEVKKIGGHSLIYMFGTALSQAVGFLMIPVYTHYIEPENYGGMEMIGILTAAIAITVMMGVSEGMSRFYYEEKNLEQRKQIVSTVVIGFSLMAIPIVIFFLAISGFLSKIVLDSSNYKYIMQISVVTVWFSLLCELGQTYLRMKYMAKTFVVSTTIQLIIALSLNVLFVVYYELGILGVFYSTLITRGLIGICLVSFVICENGIKVSLPLQYKLIKFGLPLVPSRIGIMLGFISSRFFLRWMGSPDPTIALAQIGLFSLGHKFGVVVNRFINTPFNSFWGPRKMEILMSDDENSLAIVSRICTYSIALSVYVALALSLCIESMLRIMSESGYHEAHIIVPYIAFSYTIFALDTQFATGIIMRKKTKWLSYLSFFSLGIILILNYLLIPKYLIVGAAVSTLISFFLRMILTYIISQKLFHIPYELYRLSLLFIIASLVFLIGSQINIDNKYFDFIFKFFFSIFFPIVLFIVKFFNDEEMAYLKGVILRNGKVWTS